MDTGREFFEEIPEEFFNMAEKKWPMDSGVFKVGEEIEIKGSLFKIHAIRPKKLILKLLRSGPLEIDTDFKILELNDII